MAKVRHTGVTKNVLAVPKFPIQKDASGAPVCTDIRPDDTVSLTEKQLENPTVKSWIATGILELETASPSASDKK